MVMIVTRLAGRFLHIGWPRRVVGVLLFLGSLIFLIRALAGLDPMGQIAKLEPSAPVALLVLAVLYSVSLLLLAGSWGLLATGFRPLSLCDLFAVYGRSVLAKYLPGGVLQYGSRQWSGGSIGLDQRAMARASGIEIILHLVCSGLILMILSSLDRTFVPLAAVVIMAFLVILTGLGWRCRRTLLVATCLQGLFFIDFWLIAFGTGWTMLHDADSATRLAMLLLVGWLAGFVLPFVPGGIGVREAVIVALGAGHVDPAMLVAFAALTRLVTLGGDLMLGLIAYALPLAGTDRANRQTSASQ